MSKINKLRSIGAMMANVMYNWSQNKETLTQHDRDQMKELYKQWDEAVKS